MTDKKKLRLVPKPEGGPPERSDLDPLDCSMIEIEPLSPAEVLRFERIHFEEVISAPPYELPIDRWPVDADLNCPGDYQNRSVQLAWQMWQVRARRGI